MGGNEVEGARLFSAVPIERIRQSTQTKKKKKQTNQKKTQPTKLKNLKQNKLENFI